MPDPKRSKSKSSRRPPEAAEGHGPIDEWLQGVMPGLSPIVKALDEAIRDTHGDLQYAVKWKKAYYGLPKLGWIIEVVAYDVSANVVFHGGADFDSPPPLGDRGRERYCKVRSLEEAQAPELREWIEQAGSAPGWS